ncbi:hypothetical protein IFM89_006742 [Coptis chinensis]|uniref:Uncharacterized protein n=1 Tax=Coptis chinensis TaxID=261450 RepID=A0A835HP67_9MAGN|nr:hypothetical protein IFM89_006742 [Coptis chinensis]
MALKALVFLLASFLLVTSSKVSSNEEENFMEATSLTRSPAPVKAPFPKVLPPVKLQECPLLCKGRCKLHFRPKHCIRACEKCCRRCKCVPPGTFGNKMMCGKCYTNMKTHGRLKCP